MVAMPSLSAMKKWLALAVANPQLLQPSVKCLMDSKYTQQFAYPLQTSSVPDWAVGQNLWWSNSHFETPLCYDVSACSSFCAGDPPLMMSSEISFLDRCGEIRMLVARGARWLQKDGDGSGEATWKLPTTRLDPHIIVWVFVY